MHQDVWLSIIDENLAKSLGYSDAGERARSANNVGRILRVTIFYAEDKQRTKYTMFQK